MLKALCSVLKSIPKLICICLKGTALTLLCGILFLTLINKIEQLPSPGVSSIQVENNLPPLQASDQYDFRRASVRLFVDGQFYCTGVVIGRNYLLTAAHCLVDENGVMRKQKVQVVNDDGTVDVIGKPVGVNVRMDWGLIHGNFSKIPAAFVTEVGFSAPKAAIGCGFPQGSKTLQCQTLVPAMNDGFLVKCHVGGMLFPGMSGGPVFDAEGHVIGLNILVYPAESGGGVAYSPTTGILANFKIADY